ATDGEGSLAVTGGTGAARLPLLAGLLIATGLLLLAARRFTRVAVRD
ncbi:MAG: hypothetical protein K0R60_1863, partial [Microbacterium sp.]|nr:hypothetical protein [Microbacterium sp.]